MVQDLKEFFQYSISKWFKLMICYLWWCRGDSMVSTLYSIESTVVLVEYPPGDSSEYTLDSMESQPREGLM